MGNDRSDLDQRNKTVNARRGPDSDYIQSDGLPPLPLSPGQSSHVHSQSWWVLKQQLCHPQPPALQDILDSHHTFTRWWCIRVQCTLRWRHAQTDMQVQLPRATRLQMVQQAPTLIGGRKQQQHIFEDRPTMGLASLSTVD